MGSLKKKSTPGRYAYLRGKIVPMEKAVVSIAAHSFNYGTAVFEGIRGYWSAKDRQLYIFRMRDHYDRMVRNCNMLKIQSPLTTSELGDITLTLCRKNRLREGIYIRPIAYKSSFAISPGFHGLEDDVAVYLVPLGDYVKTDGLRIMVSSYRRIMDNAIPGRGKIVGAYVNTGFAITEAQDCGVDDSIFLREDGTVSEGSAMNIFMVRNGKLITTPLTADILEGITRDSIIRLAEEQMQIEVEVRPIGRTELYICDELFFVGTGAQVAPIVELDHRPVANGRPGKLTREIQKLYFDVVQGNAPEYRHWLTPVY